MLLFKADAVLLTFFLGFPQYQTAQPRNKTAATTVIATPAMMPLFLDAGMVVAAVVFPDGCEIGALAEPFAFGVPEDIALPSVEAELVGEDDIKMVGLDAPAAPPGRSGAKRICNVVFATSP
jgi:hypothetical protein